jgi:uncharacterized RDD family membrane protein YckC
MENESVPPEKPAIPPPDLPPPPPPGAAPSTAPPVKVHVKEPGSSSEDEPEGIGRAPLNSRILATLIDMLVAFGLHLGALWILPGFAERIGGLLGIAYMVTRDSLPFLDGQSVGKKAMKIRAVTRDGTALTGKWEPGLIRNGVLIIPFFPLIELIVLLTREEKPERGLRLGDEWAKTKVVVEPEKPTAGDEPES